MKPGDLVRLKCFPPIELGFGYEPQCGLIVSPGKKHPHTWVVVLSGRECVIQESGLEVITFHKPDPGLDEFGRGLADI
jgi:hypothetical protein